MTLPYERRRAIEWAGETLREQNGNGVWAAMAAYEIAIRASHAQTVWQEFRSAAEIKGEDLLGHLLEEVAHGAERIVQAHKASDRVALAHAATSMGISLLALSLLGSRLLPDQVVEPQHRRKSVHLSPLQA